MPVYLLNQSHVFPPVDRAEPDGLLAAGGDLSVPRLLAAYKSGIFPWYSEGEPLLWWSPDPRWVLFPERLRISHSMKPVINSGRFSVTFDRDFTRVIAECACVPRRGQHGTWITSEMQEAYLRLHRRGFGHSVEVWSGEKIVGGLYGVALGAFFSGESMFAKVSNASKFALIKLAQELRQRGFQLIDCQVQTAHLDSMGAEPLSRAEYLARLAAALRENPAPGSWREWAACAARE
jgi:leucyl/phenylalanyl-tRNA---protein transferase